MLPHGSNVVEVAGSVANPYDLICSESEQVVEPVPTNRDTRPGSAPAPETLANGTTLKTSRTMGKLRLSEPVAGFPPVNGEMAVPPAVAARLASCAPCRRSLWPLRCAIHCAAENGPKPFASVATAVPSCSSTDAPVFAPATMWSWTQAGSGLSLVMVSCPSQNLRVPDPGCGMYRSI